MSFSAFARYYRNLFTRSDFQGQNRRTSVNVGGKLHRPELEMLPPATGTDAEHHHSKHIHEHLKKIEQQMFEDVEGVFHRPHHHHDEDAYQYHHFRSGSPFHHERALQPSPSPASSPRKDQTSLAPTPPYPDEEADPLSPPDDPISPIQVQQENPPHDSNLARTLDGAVPSSSPSKAELYSAEYRSCLEEPFPPPIEMRSHPVHALKAPGVCELSLLPGTELPHSPALAPLNYPRVRVTRYPSVTVIDDRQGQLRSVSLISTAAARAASFATATAMALEPGVRTGIEAGTGGSARSKGGSMGV